MPRFLAQLQAVTEELIAARRAFRNAAREELGIEGPQE
jgi:hypothetical protein